MNHSTQPSFRVSDVVAVLRAYPRRWMAPAAAIAFLCGAYAFHQPKIWEATQTMLVRNEAANCETAPGQFRDVEEMKVTQQTILEIVKSHHVLHDSLQEVGPAADRFNAEWPTLEDVAELREAVTMTAPRGVEFGKTEITYLNVREKDRERAMALSAAVSKHLESGLRRIRNSKAQSVVGELTKTVELANGDLKAATTRLARLEGQVGADLSDLRSLEMNATGDSDLRRRLNSIESELRQANMERQANERLLSLVLSAQNEPGELLATPGRLMRSQPALLRLKEGLVAAQLRTSQLLGKMSKQHPTVIASREEESAIARALHRELAMAVRGVQIDLQLAADRVRSLDNQTGALRDRLDRLARLRPAYSTLLAEVQRRTEALSVESRKLAAARAGQAAAQAASLITFVDSPILGKDPVGASRASIVLIGLIAGLATGLGILFLTVPSLQPAQVNVIGGSDRPLPSAVELSLASPARRVIETPFAARRTQRYGVSLK